MVPLPSPVSYSYKPLDAKSDIRLLVLSGGSGSDPIVCRLVPAQFIRKPFYEALSYTWGSAECKENIVLDGQNVKVQSNLWWALWHLRRRDRGRFMWVDALCINQSNHKERNHQVGLMREIYSRASDVLVWLGRHENDSELAMSYLSEVQWTESTWVPWNKRERAALKALCNREYWKRMWILQEVALARSITVHCGTHSVKWEAFDKFCFSPELRIDIPEFQTSYASKLGFIRRKQLKQQESTLMELMENFRGCICSDPRDRIFALLGLASDCRNNQLRADYSRTLFEVYQDVVQLYFPLSYSHESHLIAPYCGVSAIQFSRNILHIFGGPLDVPKDTKALKALPENNDRPVSGVTLAKPTPKPQPKILEPAQGDITTHAEESDDSLHPRTILPTLQPIPGLLKSYVFELGPRLKTYSESQPIEIDRRGSKSDEPDYVRRSPSKCIQSLTSKQFQMSYEDDFHSQVKTSTTPSRSIVKVNRVPNKDIARTLTIYTAGWTSEAPEELNKISNLRSFIAKGPRGLGIGLTTLAVQVGDMIWEVDGLLYMAVLRWVNGKYKVVGKALFFLPDGTLVTPKLRRHWEEIEKGRVNDEKLELQLDILDLHKLTC